MTDELVDPPVVEDAPEYKEVAPAVSEWILALAGDNATLPEKSAATAEKVREHAAQQEKIADLLGDLGDLRTGMTYEMTEATDSAWGKFKDKLGLLQTMQSIDKGGDPMKEIDTWHDAPGMQALPLEELQRVGKAFAKLEKVRLELEKSEAYQLKDEEGNPLRDENGNIRIDDRKLAEDLYQPLVREGVIPENAVPSRFSEVERTFKGASELYDARLEKWTDSKTDAQLLLTKLKPGFNVAEGMLKIAGGATTMAANIRATQEGLEGSMAVAQSSETRGIMDVKTQGIDVALACVVGVRTISEKIIEEDDMHSAVDALNTMLKSILTVAIDSDTAKYVYAVIAATSRSVKLVDKLSQDPPDIGGAFEALGSVIENSITADNSDNAALGKHINTAFIAAGGVAKAIQNKDPMAALEGAIKAGANSAQTEADKYKKAKRDESLETFLSDLQNDDPSLSQETLEEVEAFYKRNSTAKVSGIKELSESAQTLARKLEEKFTADAGIEVDPERSAELMEEFRAKESEKMSQMLSTPDPMFEALLTTGLTDIEEDVSEDSDAKQEKLASQVNDIETLIAMIKKDQEAVKLAKAICEGSTKFVASFLPAAGIVAVGTQMMFALIDAARHFEQLAIWQNNLAAAKKSGSVQADAMLNRFKLEKEQSIEATIRYLLKAVDLMGQIVKTAGGPAAPVGIAVSAAAQITEGAMDVAKTIKTEVEMAKAWSVYKKALATPQDRKLAREAMRSNPTLSKYAMAYGACVEKNAIAIKAMKSCGLNEKTLANPSTNVDKVVTYLETLYAEDPVLMRAVTVPEKWHPGTPELTPVSWTQFVKAAQSSKDAKPKLADADVSAVTAAFSGFFDVHGPVKNMFDAGWEADPEADPVVFEPIKPAATRLIAALGGFKPLDGDGKPHKDVTAYLESMIAKVEAVVNEIPRVQGEIRKAKELAEEQARLEEIADPTEEDIEALLPNDEEVANLLTAPEEVEPEEESRTGTEG